MHSYARDKQAGPGLRGFDELAVDGSSVFTGDKGRAGFGRSAHERVPLVGDGWNPDEGQQFLGLLNRDQIADELIARADRQARTERPLPDAVTLHDTLTRVVLGGLSYMQAAGWLGRPWTIHDIQSWVNGAGTMVGQVRKGQAHHVAVAPTAPNLFGDAFADQTAVPGVRSELGKAGAHLTDVDLEVVSVAWLARERARRAHDDHDPSWEHVMWLKYLLHYNAPPEVVTDHPLFKGWTAGLARTVRTLREELAVIDDAANRFIPGVLAGEIRATRIEIIGAISLWAPKVQQMPAHRLKVIDTDLARFLRQLDTAPPTGIHDLPEALISAICRRRGWLIGEVEQRTHVERALRGIRTVERVGEALRDAAKVIGVTETELRACPARGFDHPEAIGEIARRADLDYDHTPGGIAALFGTVAKAEAVMDTAIEQWVREGNPDAIIELMAAGNARGTRTQWVFKVDDESAQLVANMDAVARMTFAGLGGEEYQPRTFEEAVFWSDPNTVLRPATKLAQNI